MYQKYLMIVLFIFIFSLTACTTRIVQSEAKCDSDTISMTNESKDFDKNLIISLIKEDEAKRNIWSYNFKQAASSTMFYEAICDEGLYLYRIAVKNQQVFVIMVEDNNIAHLEDFIDIKNNSSCDNSGIGYEHNGYYEIINDSTINVLFEKKWVNDCLSCDSSDQEFTYHIKATHSYTFSNMTFKRIKADTIVLVDDRPFFCCTDTLMRLMGLL